MEPDPTPSSSCILCRCVFPTTEITSWLDGGRAALCPRCGADAVMAGAVSPADLERLHVRAFGGNIVLLDAIGRFGLVVHGVGLGMVAAGARAAREAYPAVGVIVGRYGTEILVDPPDETDAVWRLRTHARVAVRVGDADPGRATRIHAAAIARPLLLAGLTIVGPEETTVADGVETHVATWSGRAATAAGVALLIKEVCAVETVIEPDPADGFGRKLGDLSAMQRLADALSKSIGTTEVTPWGVTLRATDGRDLAVISEESRTGTFCVYALLPRGFGAKASRKRGAAALEWFTRTLAAAWADHGFTGARLGEPSEFEHSGEQRWAVVIELSFDAGCDVVDRLRWACDNGIVELPVSS